MRAMLLLVVLAITSPAAAAIQTLQNDSFVDGSLTYFQEGFVADEFAAVTLGPVSESFTVRKVLLLFGPDSTAGTATATLTLWTETGVADPGAELYSADIGFTPSSSAMHEIDLVGEGITVTGPASIRVGIGMQHTGYPSVARDNDGASAPGRNWIRAEGMGWVGAAVFGVAGDWVIRLEVETAGGGGPTTGCTVPADCGPGEICLAETCRRLCDVNADCAGGEVCYHDLCTAACASHDDCAGGQLCEAHACQPICTSSASCRGGEVCTENLCRTVCATDQECAADAHCAAAACLPGAPAPDEEGGCACTGSAGAPGFVLTAVGLLVRARLRRRRRSAPWPRR